ncbi:AIPR family protein [Mollicutes bacterium LVI A0078]|nr:AIPR family protein [Mollicutes bacterium LVI A0075]WOO90182.1 AIPR family protein [Mollicutes bacterium LVI A0078]
MIIKINNQTIKINEDKLEKITKESELREHILEKLRLSYEEKTQIKSMSDLEITNHSFENYTEFTKLKRITSSTFSNESEVIIGDTLIEDWDIRVDKIQNVLLNISEYERQNGYKTGIKTYQFNASLASIAKFFDSSASEAIKLNVRNDLALINFKTDTTDFEKAINISPNNFYLYNNGITLITSSDLKISNDETIKIYKPQVINGAQTICKYIYYHLDNQKEDIIEVPLRIFVVNSSDMDVFEEIAMDISLKINSHSPVTTDNLNYLEVKKLGLIDGDSGLLVGANKSSMREYQKCYTNIIMRKPGKAKSGMQKIVKSSVSDMVNIKKSTTIGIDELNYSGIIFTNPNIDVRLDNTVLFLMYFAPCALGKYVSEIELHNIISKEIQPEYKNILRKVEMNDIPTKYNLYIVGLYFVLLNKCVNDGFVMRNKDLELEEDLFYTASELIVKQTSVIVDSIIKYFNRYSTEDKNIIAEGKTKSNYQPGLTNDNYMEKEINVFSHKVSIYPVLNKILNDYSSCEEIDKETFARDYVYSANTFKTDDLFSFYAEMIDNLNFNSNWLKEPKVICDAIINEIIGSK